MANDSLNDNRTAMAPEGDRAQAPITLDNPEPYWVDDVWERTGLPMGVATRMATINGAVRGASELFRLLRADRINRLIAEDTEVEYRGLSPVQREGIECAMGSLIEQIESAVDGLQEHGRNIMESYDFKLRMDSIPAEGARQ